MIVKMHKVQIVTNAKVSGGAWEIEATDIPVQIPDYLIERKGKGIFPFLRELRVIEYGDSNIAYYETPYSTSQIGHIAVKSTKRPVLTILKDFEEIEVDETFAGKPILPEYAKTPYPIEKTVLKPSRVYKDEIILDRRETLEQVRKSSDILKVYNLMERIFKNQIKNSTLQQVIDLGISITRAKYLKYQETDMIYFHELKHVMHSLGIDEKRLAILYEETYNEGKELPELFPIENKIIVGKHSAINNFV